MILVASFVYSKAGIRLYLKRLLCLGVGSKVIETIKR